MRERTSTEIRELADDIEIELARLARLAGEIERVQNEITRDSERASLFYENLAYKLHNFYNGVERIFQLIASEINGGAPSSYDWHRRLLDRMCVEREGRIAVISPETGSRLSEFLAFRHVVRNLYGFELDAARISSLAAKYPSVWQRVTVEIRSFVTWLRALATRLEPPG